MAWAGLAEPARVDRDDIAVTFHFSQTGLPMWPTRGVGARAHGQAGRWVRGDRGWLSRGMMGVPSRARPMPHLRWAFQLF